MDITQDINETLDAPVLNWLDMRKDYPEPQYLLRYNGVGFAPLGDIQVMRAEAKNGKTFTFTILMAAVLSGDNLGFTCEHENPTVLYIDTEQHENNTALVGRRVHSMCGWDLHENFEQFRILTLRGQNPEKCRKAMLEAIELVNPMAVFVDGIADLVTDPNDYKESSDLVREFMDIAAKRNISIFTVLHVNPGSEKMRGHLGSEMMRKVSDVFNSTKKKTADGTYFEVEQVMARNRDIDKFTFTIDNSKLGVPQRPTVGEMAALDADEKMKALWQEKPSYNWSGMRDALMEKFQLKDRKAREIIKNAINAEIIYKHSTGMYSYTGLEFAKKLKQKMENGQENPLGKSKEEDAPF